MKLKFSLIIGLVISLICICGCTSFLDATGSGDVYYENLHAQNYYDVNGNDLIPDQIGNAGLVLGTNGTNTLWVAAGGGAIAHDILSATHTDSTASAVVRGDLITGQGGVAKWTALAVGSAGEYLQTDGTDVLWDALVETDPVYTGDPAFGITALDIAGWNAIVASQWTSSANGIDYSLGNVGIGVTAETNVLLSLYANDGGIGSVTALKVSENSASVGVKGIDIAVAGAKSGDASGLYIYNAASDVATASINKYGIYIRSTSQWTGVGSVNYGLYIQEPTGGTTNYSIYSDGGANYLAGGVALGTPLLVASGGTGIGTIADGSILAANATNTLTEITWHAAGTKILTNTSGTISWETAASAGMTNPMTTLGDIIYEDVTPAPARLAGDTTDTKKFLTTLSIAGVAQAPSWGTIVIGDLPTITPAKGGTGIVNNAANTLTFTGNFSLGLTLTGNTSVTMPTTGTLATLAGAETFTNKTLTQPIIQIALTAGENIAAYDACYVKSDGKAWKAKANSTTTMPALLIAQAAVNLNASGNFMGYGYITNAGWAFTPGAYLYVSEATGGLVTSTQPSTSGNQVQVVAIAVTATQIAWNPSPIVMELK
jgi:hypothetical protein